MVYILPFGDTTVNTPGFGAMGLSFGLGNNLSYEEAEPVLLKALELGCNFWDTAVSQAHLYVTLKSLRRWILRSSIVPVSTRSFWATL
jgi:aryl-alcohol dehydrogenase-like predicted oxidoreductase